MRRTAGQVSYFERAMAGFALGFLSPVLVLASIAILVVDGWPVLFLQERTGLGGRSIRVLKLRTMQKDAPPPEEVGQARAGNPLILPVIGNLLRRAKLDEIPQLLNVARGEMRFVGPRPALLSDVDDYSDAERRRLTVAPGLTGWAQVNGNTQLSWSDRIALDLYYVDHCSRLLDLRIVFMTLQTVVVGERVNTENLEEARRYAARLAGSGPIDGSGSA